MTYEAGCRAHENVATLDSFRPGDYPNITESLRARGGRSTIVGVVEMPVAINNEWPFRLPSRSKRRCLQVWVCGGADRKPGLCATVLFVRRVPRREVQSLEAGNAPATQVSTWSTKALPNF
jgi:hypothetical protein